MFSFISTDGDKFCEFFLANFILTQRLLALRMFISDIWDDGAIKLWIYELISVDGVFFCRIIIKFPQREGSPFIKKFFLLEVGKFHILQQFFYLFLLLRFNTLLRKVKAFLLERLRGFLVRVYCLFLSCWGSRLRFVVFYSWGKCDNST